MEKNFIYINKMKIFKYLNCFKNYYNIFFRYKIILYLPLDLFLFIFQYHIIF